MTILALIAAASFSAIVLIWLGYPVAVWLVAQLFRRPMRPDYLRSATRSVSVVLATREPPNVIEARVRNLLDTEHPAHLLEVVVSLDAQDSQSTAGELSHLGDRVSVANGDAPGGKACALNAGVRAATGELLVFADSAQRFNRRTIPELIAGLEDERFGVVSGALTLGQEGGNSPVHWYWALEKWLRFNESLVHSSIGVTGAVYATRRDTWPVIPENTILDDVYVPMTLVMRGKRVGFTYAAKATDIRTFDVGKEGDRKQRTLTGVVQLLTLIPGIAGIANPVFFQFWLHKLARFATPLFGLIFLLSGSTLAAMLVVAYPNVLVPLLVALALLTGAVPALRQGAVRLFSWAFSLQRSISTSLVNGLHGRWAVWKK